MAEAHIDAPALASADEALRIAGLNLRSLFDRFPFAVQVFSLDGHSVYENPAHNELWEPVDRSKPMPSIFERNDLAALGMMADIRRGFAGEMVTLPPTRYDPRQFPRFRAGTPRWIRTFIYPVSDDAGEMAAIVAMHVDITEREEAQQTLEQRVEERTRELTTLLEISRSVSSTLEPAPLLGVVLDQLQHFVDYTSATVVIREGERFVMREYRGPLPREVVLSRPLPTEAVMDLLAAVPQGEPLIIPDIWADTPAARAYRATRGEEYLRSTAGYLRCLLSAPLIHRGQLVGSLVLAHETPSYFTTQHAALAQAVADQVAGAIENTHVYEQQRSTARELASLLEVSRNLAATLELQPLLDVVFDQIKVMADFTGASIMLRDEDIFRLIHRRGPTELGSADARAVAIPVRRAERLAERLLNRQPVIIADIRADEPLAAAYREALGAPVETTHASYARAWMGVPLALKEQVIGIIGLAHTEPGFYTSRHAELVSAIATQAAAAIENARLYEQAHKLAALEERQRLARELHDSVSQVLFSINLGAGSVRTLLERNNPERAAASVENILKLAEMGMAEMRALLFELRPESLAQEGLVAAITKQAAALHARHGIAVETTLGDEPNVPLDLKEALYRIAQEATHNTVKHAGADHIDIRLAYDTRELTLEVADNGQGFDTSRDFPGHLGLRSMRERVARFGGTVLIDGAMGQGTTVRARIPLHSPA